MKKVTEKKLRDNVIGMTKAGDFISSYDWERYEWHYEDDLGEETFNREVAERIAYCDSRLGNLQFAELDRRFNNITPKMHETVLNFLQSSRITIKIG